MQTLRLFADVARYRSFSEAAMRHGVTQSAASQRVSQLERQLGVRLIDRSVRPLVLTDAGRVYFEGTQDLVQRYDRLERRVMAMSGSGASRIRMTAIYSAGIELLEQIRGGYQAEHPQMEVEIRYDKPDDIYQLVLDEEVDLGVVSYPDRLTKVCVVPLRQEPMALVCRPDHPFTERSSIQAQQLQDQPMVNFDTDLPVGRAIVEYLRTHGAKPAITHSFDNLDTLKQAVSVTDRFAILPRRTVKREVEAGTLSVIDLEPSLVRPIGVIHPRGGKGGGDAHRPEIGEFIEFLRAHGATDPTHDPTAQWPEPSTSDRAATPEPSLPAPQ